MLNGVLVECVLALAFECRYRSSRTWDWDMIRAMNEAMVLRCTRVACADFVPKRTHS
jgi:hypothetical protein